LAFDPSGKFLYAAHAAGTINIYSLDATSGAITSTGSATAGTDPRAIVFK
jgi:6-phosphogluconolactonase (cycloisomerase 2 family)